MTATLDPAPRPDEVQDPPAPGPAAAPPDGPDLTWTWLEGLPVAVVAALTGWFSLLSWRGMADEPSRYTGPLLTAALDNGLRRGDAALTGPVSRGDVRTVADHLQTLAERAPDAVGAYLAMARRTTERARAAGRLKPHEAAPLVDLLDGSPEVTR